MKISTKGRYGLRVLLDVALNEGDGVVSLRDISRRQDVSRKYLWQIVNLLKNAGILRATRGVHGGYALARAASEISLYDTVTALEGAAHLVNCMATPDSCGRGASCIARDAWLHVETRLNEVLKEITLKELVRRHREMGNAPTYMI